MDILLWILQGVLGAMYLMVGLMKVMKPKEQMLEKMGWVNDFTQGQINVIGFAEMLGGIGLVLPLWLDVVPILTPIAAGGLALLMLGALFAHRRRQEVNMEIVTFVLFLVLTFVSYSRFV